MAYVTIATLQARVPQFPLTATSRPTAEEAQIFITDVESEVEAMAATRGYIIPITGPISLRVLRHIVILGATARILYARAAGVGGDAAMQSADKFQKLYEDALKALWEPDGPFKLVDAPVVGVGVPVPMARSSFLAGSDNGDPRIEMDTLF